MFKLKLLIHDLNEYLPLILVVVGLVFLILFFFQKRRDYVTKKNFWEVTNHIFSKVKPLNFLKNYIDIRIPIFNKKKREKTVISLCLAYIFYILFLLIYIPSITPLWYVSIVGIVIGTPLPIVFLNWTISKYKMKAIKQLPDALDELSLAFSNQPTLLENLNSSSDEMPYEIGLEFKRLSELLRTSDPKKSIEEFVKRTDSEWTKILGVILLFYINKGGNISQQLDYLNDNISYNILFKTKVQRTMLLPKFVLIIMLGAMFFLIDMIQKMMPVVKIIFATDPVASSMLVVFVLSIVAGLLALNLIQRT